MGPSTMRIQESSERGGGGGVQLSLKTEAPLFPFEGEDPDDFQERLRAGKPRPIRAAAKAS